MRALEILRPCDFKTSDGEPTGALGVLRCRGCGHTVTDLVTLTEADALAFFARRAPRDCVRFRVNAEGRVRFADGVGSLIARIAEHAAPMLSVASLALSACALEPSPKTPDNAVEEGLPLVIPLAPASAPAPAPAPVSAPVSVSASAPQDDELTGYLFSDDPIVPPPDVRRPKPRDY